MITNGGKKQNPRKGTPYKTPEERKTTQLFVRLDQGTADKLERMAAAAGCTKSALIRRWIEEHVEE